MNELDRILLQSDAPPPSDGFRRSVMRAIREEPATEKPLAFPWAWVAACLLAALVGVPLVTLWLGAGGPASLGKLPWLLAVLAASSLSLFLPLQLLRE